MSGMSSGLAQVLRVGGALLGAVGWSLVFSVVAHAGQIACPGLSNPTCLPGFPVEFSGPGIPTDIGYVEFSSPTVARLGIVSDAKSDIVVGTTGGYVVAYHSDGTFLWARKTGAIAIQSKPAIADIDGDGQPEVVVGAGDPGQNGGGIYVLRADGSLKCSYTDLDTAPLAGGIYSSPAVGRFDPAKPSELQIVFGSFDAHVRALHADCSLWWIKGVADGVIDTIWSSPAIYDLDGDGQLDVIIGQDSGIGTVPGTGVQIGGMMRAFRGNGVGELPGFPIKLDDVIYSSPAIGDIAGARQPGIISGYGRCYDIAACAPGGVHPVTEAVFGWSRTGAALAGFPYPMPSQSTRTSSPALVDLDGDGKLESIIATLVKTGTPATNDRDGYIHVVRSNGAPYPGWPVQPKTAASCTTDVSYGTTFASPIAVDLDGDGIAEILSPVALQISVWNRDAVQLSFTHAEACSGSPTAYFLRANSGIYSTPTAADFDGDGKIEMVVGSASTVGGPVGALFAWRFPNSIAKPDNLPWPQFRHDSRNTGVYLPDRIFRNGFD